MILLTLFLEFLEIGAFTFGGGYASIPLIMQIIEEHGWMTKSELINFIAVAESTPGTFAVNISTFVGAKTAGILGSIISILGFVLPCFIVIVIIAKIYNKFRENIIMQGLLFGLNSTVVGLIAATVVTVGQEILFPTGISLDVFIQPSFYVSLVIFGIGIFLLLYKKLSPLIIIGISAVLGVIAGYCGLLPV